MVDAERLTDLSSVEQAYETVVLARESVSVVEWLEHRLHPVSSYMIVPVFALANAGVVITSKSLDRAVTSPVAHGIVLGLVVGKLVGISGFAWLAHRLRIAVLPGGSGWPQLVSIAALGGIGFTVSLFVSNLAFGDGGPRAESAKISILAASILAALTGAILVRLTTRNRARTSGPGG
jgi:NhaA family Na+:H+ antiporter